MIIDLVREGLLPYPFCGGMELDTRYDNSIECKNGNCGGGINLGHHIDIGDGEAIKVRNEVWNTRSAKL